MQNDKILRGEYGPIHDAFTREDTEFTPWLKKNIDLLGQSLRMEITAIERESE